MVELLAERVMIVALSVSRDVTPPRVGLVGAEWREGAGGLGLSTTYGHWAFETGNGLRSRLS